MEKLELHAKVRKERGKKIKTLRANGFVPGIVYGTDFENLLIAIEQNKIEKIYGQAGESSLINLVTEDNAEPLEVLFQDVSKDPITGKIIHVDFYKIKKGQKLTTNIELNFIGESRAVKDLGGTLIKSIDEVEVECLPKDLVSIIAIDISALKTFEDKILIKDIKAPEGIEILNEPELVVSSVEKPRSDEELKALEEKVVENVEAVKSSEPKKIEENEEEKTKAEKK